MIRWLIVLIISAMLTNCFTSSHATRGKLSDVMDKASDDNEGERVVEEAPEPMYPDDEDEEGDETSNDLYFTANNENDSIDTHSAFNGHGLLTLRYDLGVNGQNYYHRMNQVVAGLGYYGDRAAIIAFVGHGWQIVNAGDDLGSSIHSPVSDYFIGLEGHFYTTPD